MQLAWGGRAGLPHSAFCILSRMALCSLSRFEALSNFRSSGNLGPSPEFHPAAIDSLRGTRSLLEGGCSTSLLALRSDEPHRREEGADAAWITGEQGQMGDVGVRTDEEIREWTSFLAARPAVFLEGFSGLKGGIEQ